MTLLEPWLDKLPGAVLHVALPAHAKRCRRAWRVEFISALPVGFCDERRGLELRELLPLIPAEKLLIKLMRRICSPRDLTPKPSSGATSQPICPFFNVLRTAWRRCRMAGCHHGCQCQNTVWDCVLEFAELGVLHTVLNLFINKIQQ